MTIKNCSSCKETLPASAFYENKAKPDGRSNMCITCQKAANRKSYEKNKTKVMARNKAVRQQQRAAILEHKHNTPCTDCKKIFHPYIMEFDHRDADTKRFSIGRTGRRSNPTIQDELEKCDLVCANCHKLRTFKRRLTSNPEFLPQYPELGLDG